MSVRALALALLLAPAAHAMGDPFDWLVISFDLPEGAHAFSVWMGIEGESEAARLPSAAILALRGAVGGFAYERDENASYVATSGTVGPARVWITPPERREDANVQAFSLWSPDSDATTVRTLFLSPGLEGRRWSVTVVDDVRPGPVPVDVVAGSGSRAVALTGLDAGLALSAGDASAGSGGASRTVDVAIAGTLTFECAMGPCESTWTSPTGDTGTLSADGYGYARSAYGRDAFAGPAGAWSFAWQGAQWGDSVALYAPLADLAPLFG